MRDRDPPRLRPPDKRPVFSLRQEKSSALTLPPSAWLKHLVSETGGELRPRGFRRPHTSRGNQTPPGLQIASEGVGCYLSTAQCQRTTLRPVCGRLGVREHSPVNPSAGFTARETAVRGSKYRNAQDSGSRSARPEAIDVPGIQREQPEIRVSALLASPALAGVITCCPHVASRAFKRVSGGDEVLPCSMAYAPWRGAHGRLRDRWSR